MKTALITTTINVPHVLQLYRKLGLGVKFFVAVDEKTPKAAVTFCQHEVADTHVVSIEQQQEYKCSALIGWNCIMRRNLATLEALKWGADYIVSIDDDNIPLGGYFGEMFEALTFTRGIQASSWSDWFDVGTLLDPVSSHRGFPSAKKSESVFSSVVDARVGVAAGICLGDPDIDATTRMVNAPNVHHVSELLRTGIVVKQHCKTVFNSQNTAFIRELAPAFFMFPGVGRYDDIFASLVMQRIMRERGLYVHFGQPFVWQQRNPHNLAKDLKAEIWGMEHVVEFADALDGAVLSENGSVIEHMRAILKHVSDPQILPAQAIMAAEAWCNDCEKVMG